MGETMALDYHYYNLNKSIWSVQNRGRVIAHVTERIIEDPEFVVRPGGQRKVREERRKNVHAFVKGREADPHTAPYGGAPQGVGSPEFLGWVEVSYNPYRDTGKQTAPFYEKKTGDPVYRARWAYLTPDRKLFVRYF